jgi:type I restriction-modification system DNA methylase subunit
MPAPEIIHQLVNQFAKNRDAYHSSRYNETQLRLEFLNPFFAALGWDMYNRNNYAPQNREVIHEDSIDIEGGSRAPDYCFRLGQTRKFFVEAKKPAVNIKYDIHPAYQLRRYAWNAHLPLSILTDFEELAVYDCRNKPIPSDSAATARVMLIPYTQYVERWDELTAVFSRDAIWRGSFDKYAADTSSKRGTTEVDDAFLADIEEWRTLLARNIALRNQHVVNERQLNYAVQMTIDRIIFLRICEDRGIEPANQLLDMSKSKGIYPQMVQLYQRADLKYNSGLFHFKSEKGESNHADKFTPSLEIDDRVLKEIIKSLYYPCPYIFKEIPVEILGQVYEQFLGKVIRLTPGRQAKIEEKPEVRKAGGVYYTPSYIVDYIVTNTVGKLVEGMNPEQVSQLRVVDPACGSGSFLLGAFQYLLDWHEGWYLQHDPQKWVKGKLPALIPTEGGGWKLTTAEKKRILVNNIYGVDIDAQAVEVTKLSLLLKVLEEESGQLSLGLERVLPDLGDNIKCGNSLIGWDYFEGQLIPDEKELERVNPFDWQRNFPQVFARGGFDAVIGNPPYVQSRDDQFEEKEKKYYFKKYQAAEYQINTFSLFLEKGINLLNFNCFLGMIIPNYWLSTKYDKKLRDLIFNKNDVQELLNVYNVFNDASVDTLILISSRTYKETYPKNFLVKSISRELRNIPDRLLAIQEKKWSYVHKHTLFESNDDLSLSFVEGITLNGIKTIEEIFDLKFGMKPYELGKGNPPQSKKIVNEKPFIVKDCLGQDYVRLLKARNVKRYNLKWQGDWIKYGAHLAAPRDPLIFEGERILLQRIVSGDHLDGTFTDEKYICNTDVITLKPKRSLENHNIKFFLGIVVSKLLLFYLRSKNVNLDRETYPKINTNTLYLVKIPFLNFTTPKEVEQHDRMVALVERMLELHKRDPQTPQEADRIQREITATDAAIDRLVYELYGLTEEEVRIVEGES